MGAAPGSFDLKDWNRLGLAVSPQDSSYKLSNFGGLSDIPLADPRFFSFSNLIPPIPHIKGVGVKAVIIYYPAPIIGSGA